MIKALKGLSEHSLQLPRTQIWGWQGHKTIATAVTKALHSLHNLAYNYNSDGILILQFINCKLYIALGAYDW